MSKLRALAEKELANLNVEKFNIVKLIEQTKQSLLGREQSLKDIETSIQELETYLNPKPVEHKKKGKK